MVAEIWDVYDRDGNATGKVVSRGDALRAGEYHLGASLWIARPDGRLLIQKRAPQKRIGPGKWSITGGAVRAGETSVDGCLREVQEEIGLRLRAQDIELLARSFGTDIIFDDYVAVLDSPPEAFRLQAEEVSEVRWARVAEIRELFDAGEFMFDDMSEMDKLIAYMEKRAPSGVQVGLDLRG